MLFVHHGEIQENTPQWLSSLILQTLTPSTAQVNIVNNGTVATEIQSASTDNVLATGVTATLLASDGVYVVIYLV